MKNTFENLAKIEKNLNEMRARSAWQRGVREYAFDILDNFKEWASLGDFQEITRPNAMNGAETWHAYSYGGSALIYDADIAERLCAASELRRVRTAGCGVRSMANGRETWLDIQAYALHQAWQMIERAMR